jgi:hypothetical protein
MTNTPWIFTEVHRNPDCLEWIISTERPTAPNTAGGGGIERHWFSWLHAD